MMTDTASKPEGATEFHKLSPAEANARKKRSAMTALVLFGFVLLIFVITISRLGENAAAVSRGRDLATGNAPAKVMGPVAPTESSAEFSGTGQAGEAQ